MNPEELFDEIQHRPARLSRRRLLPAGVAGAGSLMASPALASVSALMCPPRVGSFGGSAGAGGDGGGMMTGDIDYSGEVPDDGPGLRRLKMINAHTGEVFDRPYVVDGDYDQEALEEFTHFARDWRENEWISFDPSTIDIVWKVWRKLDVSEPFRLNSGYRSPKTNASLPGAAKQSQHLKAKAADISMGARSVRQIHAAAVSLKAGGVGKYTSSHFVHVDSGRVRYWGS